jgi:hypothetical protein
MKQQENYGQEKAAWEVYLSLPILYTGFLF